MAGLVATGLHGLPAMVNAFLAPKTINAFEALRKLSPSSSTSVEFMLLAQEIEKKDREVNGMLKAARLRSEVKDLIARRMDGLRQLKGMLDKDEDKAFKLGELWQKQFGGQGLPGAQQLKQMDDRFGILLMDVQYDPASGKISQVATGVIGDNPNNDPGSPGDCLFTSDDIEQRLQTLGDEMQKLDSDNHIEMIKLKDQIDKKSQLVQLLSNIVKKTNDTHTSIIQNIK